ncbi:hypothetical protein QQ020_00380 [Fulvivirgaceae bacterium BMA12]|uniref:Uncharacterized protein n=1 Tax=Agaribacillus aureus TaxID=3051825 RepID=A0ABT8L1V0_9BACT|nr:hypothetical protein [Fulvivirgaceae bacterium BMA12]
MCSIKNSIRFLLTGSLALLIVQYCNSQSTKFGEYIYIKKKTEISYLKNGNKKLTLEKGTELKKKQNFISDKVKYDAELKRILNKNEDFTVKKNSLIKTKNLYGKANISQKKDTLYINFWLFKKGAKPLSKQDRSIQVVDNYNYKRSIDDRFRDSDITEYERDKKYFIILKNRQTFTVWHRSIEISALSIPLKIRPSININNAETNEVIKEDLIVSANFNVSTFVGVRFGQQQYTYRWNEEIPPGGWAVTVGAFAGIGIETLDSLNTSNSPAPLEMKKDIGSFSLGLGMVLDIKGFKLGFFVGQDRTSNSPIARKWNYRNKAWYGVGFGYKLPLFKDPSK